MFVHGYSGDYNGTWNEFQAHIRKDIRFIDTDIVYYGYASRCGQIGEHTDDLLTFVRSIVVNRLNYSNASGPDWSGYESIVIVAHSMGAVLTRKAMLVANNDHDDWVERTRMVLFAPAHMGTGVVKNVLANIHWLVRVFAAILSTASMPIAELDPKLSEIIPDLKTNTQRLLERGKGDLTKAFRLIWAVGDLVVTNDFFGEDPQPDKIKGKTHQSVCKPDQSTFQKPFVKLVEAITL